MPPPGARLYASQSLAGDHITAPTGSLSTVTRAGHPPSAGTTQICGMPLKSDTNAIRLPSGEKLGELARPTFAIRATSAAIVDVCWAKALEAKTRSDAVNNCGRTRCMGFSFSPEWYTRIGAIILAPPGRRGHATISMPLRL